MNMLKILCCALLFSMPIYSEKVSNDPDYLYLDDLALKAGTDKSSSYHNYTEIYSQYFAKLKDEPITFLEIGIYKGNSVKLWESYFSKADLHFADISASLIEYYSTRSTYHFLDQSNAKALKALGKEVGSFDVIIDDGGHFMNQQIISFQNLFPYLKSGGLYIIEDLHTSYWTSYGGHGTTDKPLAGAGTAVEFFKNLVEQVNYCGARTSCADLNKVPDSIRNTFNIYQKSIYSIHFYDSVCIIKKW